MNGTTNGTQPGGVYWNVFKLSKPQTMTAWDIGFGLVPGFGIYLLTFFFALLVFALKGTKSAVKSKQLPLMFTFLIFSFFFSLSYYYSNGLIIQTSQASCTIVNTWLMMMGVCGMVSCLVARLLHLFTVLQLRKKPRVPGIVITLLMLIPVVVYCIFGSIFSGNKFQEPTEEEKARNHPGDCFFTTWGVVLHFVFTAVYVLLFIIASCMTIRIRKEFNESKIEMIAAGFWTLAFVAFVAVYVLRLHFLIPIRIIITTLPVIIGCGYFWMVFGEVVFRILTCNNKWFDEWLSLYHKRSAVDVQKRVASFKARHGGSVVISGQAMALQESLLSNNNITAVGDGQAYMPVSGDDDDSSTAMTDRSDRR